MVLFGGRSPKEGLSGRSSERNRMVLRRGTRRDINPVSTASGSNAFGVLLSILDKTGAIVWPLWLSHGPPLMPSGGRKRLSLIQMVLLTHLKLGLNNRGQLSLPDSSVTMAQQH